MAYKRQIFDDIEDELLLYMPEGSPPYRCWKPDPALPLAMPDHKYGRLEKIARVLHFEDHIKIFKNSAIIPNPILDVTHSSMLPWAEGTWFGVPPENGRIHNWYGNISYQVDFKSFIRTFRPNYYLIEIVEYKTTSTPRLLLTTQNVPEEVTITEYDPYEPGGPWLTDENGEHFYLKDIRRYMNCGSNEYPAELEIFIVLSHEEYKGLYDMCDKIAVDHSEANCTGYRKCKKYKSGGRNLPCKSDWFIEKCQLHLDRLRCGYFDKDKFKEELVKNY